jgi:hypothetical protein
LDGEFWVKDETQSGDPRNGDGDVQVSYFLFSIFIFIFIFFHLHLPFQFLQQATMEIRNENEK